MCASEIAIIAVCMAVGVAICIGPRKLAEQEKRLFPAVPYPLWFITARNCIIGISIITFGFFSRDKVFQALAPTHTCPDRGTDIFALVLGMILLVMGIVTKRIRKRQDVERAVADAARMAQARPVPQHARVVRLTKEEQYPNQPPPSTAIVIALNGVALIIIGILGLTGTFCVFTLIR